MRFWDASALVPLLVVEAQTSALLALLQEDPLVLVWWGSPVECISAIARRERDGSLAAADVTHALARLRSLTDGWQEILPTSAVRSTAQRLLRVHPLRAADAFQLAAALVAAEHDPSSLRLVCLDDRLAEAAQREGFEVEAGESARAP